MAFSIEFIDEKVPKSRMSPGQKYARWAWITIGDFTEPMIIPTHYWSEEQYKLQWVEGLERILSPDSSKSYLVTEMYDPAESVGSSYAVMGWPVFREGDTIYVHNQWLACERFPEPFALSDVYTVTDDRSTFAEDGDSPSEWTSSVPEMRDFLNSLRRELGN